MTTGQTRKEKTAQELFNEREKRISDAIALKVPDRVPIHFFVGYFAAKYNGITCEPVYYDAEKWRAANRKTILDFEPDTYWVQGAALSGVAMEILGARQMRWPGHGVPPHHSHQMLELEPMKGEEYAAFMQDQSDFIVRTYLPRVWDAAAPLAKLPPLRSLVGPASLVAFAGLLAQPEMAGFLESLRKAGEAQVKFQAASAGFNQEMAELGFPSYFSSGVMAAAPFDTISDNLRGMGGTMIDMYRRPDELLAACEHLAADRIRAIKQTPLPVGPTENRRVFIALHRGSDGFMSLKQFEKFYWPGLKQVIYALVDAGWTPCPFFEGVWDQRLEYLLELPKGKVLCHFAQTDPKKAKEVLGGHLCIMVDVPGSLLQAGSVREVEEYCKMLIDVCGKDGGFIMTTTCIDEASPTNLKAMFDFTKRYGKYT